MWFLNALVYQLSVGALAFQSSSIMNWEGVLTQSDQCSELTLEGMGQIKMFYLGEEGAWQSWLRLG